MAYRKFGEKHINQSLKQANNDLWIIGKFTLRRLAHQRESATWNDSDGSSWIIAEEKATLPIPTSQVDTPYIKLIHEAGDASAVWSIGNCAICKVRYWLKETTQESVTLDFVREKERSFDVPKVLHHAFDDDRSYLFLERLPGRTLDVAWPSLSESWKHHYVNATVQACQEMAQWRGNKLGGVDGQHVPEYFLIPPPGGDDFDRIPAGCKAIGVGVSDLVFYHADLGPTNLIIEDEPSTGRIGIIDFEIAGYLPRGWVRTKFRLSSGMDLSSTIEPKWWRSEMQKALGTKGFEDRVDAFFVWKGWE